MTTSFAIGDVRIDRIVEQEGPLFDALDFFPALTAERLADSRGWLDPAAIDAAGQVVLCIQSYLVRTPHHTILIDSCVGNGKHRPNRPFWHQRNSPDWERGLAATGTAPEQVDFVMCTHLHVDHVGWNTRLVDGRWVPTFPNARYVFAETELNHWLGLHATTPNPILEDSVIPILDAKQAEIVRADHGVGDHLRFTPTPGHTPGHVAVELGRGRTEAVFTGDLIHSPLQLRHPEISPRVDVDPVQAAATRRRFLECHCETQALVCTAHFPSPSTGRIGRAGGGFRIA